MCFRKVRIFPIKGTSVDNKPRVGEKLFRDLRIKGANTEIVSFEIRALGDQKHYNTSTDDTKMPICSTTSDTQTRSAAMFAVL